MSFMTFFFENCLLNKHCLIHALRKDPAPNGRMRPMTGHKAQTETAVLALR